MDYSNYYKSEKIDNNIIKIISLTGEILYLIEGTEKAVLIDTCLGVGNLKKFVEGLTDKPITVILTHGHVDHAMGAPEFDEVYLSDKDKGVFMEHSPLEIRQEYMAMNLHCKIDDLKALDYVQPVNMKFKSLNDGDIFNLGGINLEVFEVAGHTKGSVAILIKEKKILVLGDACNTATFLFDDNSLCVEEYRNNLIKLNEKLNNLYNRVFLSHHQMEIDKSIISNVIEVCNDILNEKTDDLPFEFMGECHYIAKAIANERFERVDGKIGNIIYNKNKVKIL